MFIWHDRALFVGDRSETATHSHHALEVSLALDGRGVDVGSPGGPSVTAAGAVMVRADAPHALSIPGPKVAVLYLDPHTPLGKGLTDWLGDAPLREVPAPVVAAAREAFVGLFDRAAGIDEAAQAMERLLSPLAPDPPRPRLDWRVRRAKEALEARLAEPPKQAELAAELGLSGSRLGHLFSAEVGLPMRRYVLWMRLRAALTEALATGSMTDAALAAGFADAAHFTRTCRRMFGLAPSTFAPVDDVFVR